MKRFCYRILIFVAGVILVIAPLYFLLPVLVLKQEVHVFRLNPDIRTVFVGDSNVESAIDDSLISHSVNIAHSGDAYLYTYHKLKAILEHTSRVETVFVGYAPHNLSWQTEKLFLYSDGELMDKMVRYNYLITLHEQFQLFRHNPKTFLAAVPASIVGNIGRLLKACVSGPLTLQTADVGGYVRLDRNKLQEDQARFAKQDQTFEKGQVQLQYLEMISRLCKQKAVRLVLLNTPKHKFLLAHLDKQVKDYWSYVAKDVCQAEVMDCSEFALPDSYYADLMHLNYKGAEVFSKYLDSRLHSGDHQHVGQLAAKALTE